MQRVVSSRVSLEPLSFKRLVDVKAGVSIPNCPKRTTLVMPKMPKISTIGTCLGFVFPSILTNYVGPYG